MKIAVCLKQVPDMESKFKIVDDKKIDESQIAFKINDFDNYAVEAALQLKEKLGGEVIIVTCGPDRASKDIRQAFAMGADWGIHVNDPAVESGDNFVVASTLQKAIESIGGVELVLSGVQAEDDQSAATGVMLADLMGWPHCTNVKKLEISGTKLTVNRELEGGFNEVIEMNAPAVLTIQSGINEPRYPTLPGIMKAKKKPVDVKKAADLGVSQAPMTATKSMSLPPARQAGKKVEGDDAEAKARALAKALHEEAKLI
jgi:electron transfer flavoprotein beta subunit